MSMITTTYPPRGLESNVRSTATAPARTWGFWATLGWFGVAVVTYFAATFLAAFFYALWWGLTHPNVPLDMNAPVLGYLMIAVPMPAAALALMLAARRAGPSMRSYLGLVWPRWRHILVGFGALIVLGALIEGLFRLFPTFDQTPELIAEYRSIMGNPTALALYWFTLVVTAPVAEEIIFRGFLLRGWSESRIGMVGTIVLTSLAFAVIHVQYNVLGLFMVLSLGLLFGVMRWRSGSTVLTIMMHAAWNLMCGIVFMLHV